ncbi:MAG: hypothetical protein NC355_04240 [Blautia sp.]|nr:hypothetical protein [Blautia sp.]MCM1237260.1 hypothetical protein [Ruminococcus flavefaciens]
MKEKTTVFWGVGTLCRAYLENNAKIEPSFFIDSNYYGEEFYGKKVLSPEAIEDWQGLFVIIMCKFHAEIVNDLKAKGLRQGTDFITYDMLCDNRKITYRESIEQCREFAAVKNYKNTTLLFIPVFTMRQNGTMLNFLAAYQEAHKNEQCIILTDCEGMDTSGVIEKYGWDVIALPLLSNWYEAKEYKEALKAEDSGESGKTKNILEIMHRKHVEDVDCTGRCLALMYEYYEQLLMILEAKRIIVWAAWNFQGYVLGRLAEKHQIPIGFMEFGWIPGTYQIDRKGIQGQGEYAVNPQKLLDIKVEKEELDRAGAVKSYIIDSQRDTGIFHKTMTDDEHLAKLDTDRKTVFVAGMDDEGMGMNPESDYWYQYVSHCFQSSKEMLAFLYDICRRNDWNLIFKPHPHYNKGNLPDIADIGSGIILVLDRDVDSLIQMSDVTVCMASAVEYKALMYGKPVVPVGRSAIQGKNCAYEVSDSSEIETALQEAVQKGMTKEQNAAFDMHLAQLMKTCLWDDLSRRVMRYGLPVTYNFFEEERV